MENSLTLSALILIPSAQFFSVLTSSVTHQLGHQDSIWWPMGSPHMSFVHIDAQFHFSRRQDNIFGCTSLFLALKGQFNELILWNSILSIVTLRVLVLEEFYPIHVGSFELFLRVLDITCLWFILLVVS